MSLVIGLMIVVVTAIDRRPPVDGLAVFAAVLLGPALLVDLLVLWAGPSHRDEDVRDRRRKDGRDHDS